MSERDDEAEIDPSALGQGDVVAPPNPDDPLVTVVEFDFRAKQLRKITIDEAAPAIVRDTFSEMTSDALSDFRDYGLAGDLRFKFVADMRFVGQAFEIAVDIDESRLADLTRQQLIDDFIAAHHRVYLHGASAKQAIEIVGFRLEATRPIESLPLMAERELSDRPARQTARMQGNDGAYEVAVLSAPALARGVPQDGPALIEGYSTTTLVPEGWAATRDENDNLIVRRKG